MRNVKSRWPILFINILLGWAFIGWLVCFVWAFVSPSEIKRRPIRYTPEIKEQEYIVPLTESKMRNDKDQTFVFCNECGSKNSKNSKFCSKCGNSLGII